jgi:F1F0 ATPase subunit 2
MNDLSMILLMFLAGGVMGFAYFTGLWFTVRRLHNQRRPAIWLATSFFIRLGLVIVALYWLLAIGRWEYVVAALAGFLLLRSLTIKNLRRNSLTSASKQKTPA